MVSYEHGSLMFEPEHVIRSCRALSYSPSHRAPQEPWSLSRRIGASVATAILLLTTGVVVAQSTPVWAADYVTPPPSMFLYDDSFRHPNDHYTPILSPYDDTNPAQVQQQLAGIKYSLGDRSATIMTWWGQGEHGEQATMPVLYTEAAKKGLGVIPYYEKGATPSVAEIRADLNYLKLYVDKYPDAAVRIGGKPVIFVYNTTGSCSDVVKWSQATYGFTEWYVNLKVFSGFRTCPVQPSSWHQYGPANPDGQSVHLPWSFNISPGFWKYTESTPRLVRDPARWALNISNMLASGAQWKLVTSWGELGEGTSVEPLVQFPPTGEAPYGPFAEVLHDTFSTPVPVPTGSPTPTPSTTMVPPSPTPTSTPSPTSNPTLSPTVTISPTASSSPTAPPTGSVTVAVAGDIVETPPCNGYTSGCQDGWTAGLLTEHSPTAILTAGDNQYESGTLTQYNAGWNRITCVSTSQCDAWGKHLATMYPAPGNHEGLTPNFQGYRDYFGTRFAAIGSDTLSPNPQMYYSFDLGAWHLVSLNSSCSQVGGCGLSSPQGQWLAKDLAANNGRPTILYFHHPRWSSGAHGNITGSDAFWRAAVNDLDVQMVLNGHDHWLEGFAPLGVDGLPAANGVREFVVGTGGKGFTCGTTIRPGSQAHQCTSMGVLLLTLNASSYSWSFQPVSEVGGPGPAFVYSGSSGLRLPAGLAGVVDQTSTAITSLGSNIATVLSTVKIRRKE